MAVATYTKSGTKSTTPAKLDKAVFGVKVDNHQLLKDVYISYLANYRQNLAKTKTRAQVRGGGAKPWRQKGTGRARFGSIRNPIWKGGGVAFGPTGIENYSRQVNRRSKRLALRQALSLAAAEDRIKIIDTFTSPDGKAKQTVELLKKISAQGQVLIIVSLKDELVERATRNLPGVKAIDARYLTVYDVMNADSLVVSREALGIIEKWLGGKSE